MNDELSAIQQQDDLRPVRMFVNLVSGALGIEQTIAETDNGVGTRSGQYQTVSPYGVSVEGRPVSNLQTAAITLPFSLILLAGIGFLVLKK